MWTSASTCALLEIATPPVAFSWSTIENRCLLLGHLLNARCMKLLRELRWPPPLARHRLSHRSTEFTFLSSFVSYTRPRSQQRSLGPWRRPQLPNPNKRQSRSRSRCVCCWLDFVYGARVFCFRCARVLCRCAKKYCAVEATPAPEREQAPETEPERVSFAVGLVFRSARVSCTSAARACSADVQRTRHGGYVSARTRTSARDRARAGVFSVAFGGQMCMSAIPPPRARAVWKWVRLSSRCLQPLFACYIAYSHQLCT